MSFPSIDSLYRTNSASTTYAYLSAARNILDSDPQYEVRQPPPPPLSPSGSNEMRAFELGFLISKVAPQNLV
jgi:hypothetical protein